jgi:hypothetical protein
MRTNGFARGRVPTTTWPIYGRNWEAPRIGKEETRTIARSTNFRANATRAPFFALLALLALFALVHGYLSRPWSSPL